MKKHMGTYLKEHNIQLSFGELNLFYLDIFLIGILIMMLRSYPKRNMYWDKTYQDPFLTRWLTKDDFLKLLDVLWVSDEDEYSEID